MRGNYVYIDVWATWCGPCFYEFPYLEKLKKAYKDKPIKFVSISLDKQKDKKIWKETLKKEKLGGIQLIADKDFNSEFIKFFKIQGIPRFILLNKEGEILEKNPPRPSFKKEIKELLDSLQ